MKTTPPVTIQVRITIAAANLEEGNQEFSQSCTLGPDGMPIFNPDQLKVDFQLHVAYALAEFLSKNQLTSK
jgi:hypothetical protein